MSRPTHRRGFLRGFAIISATTAVGALALPTAAEAATSHPDADLLAAFVEIERSEAEYKAACKIASEARLAAKADDGPIPEVLMLNAEENALCRCWERMSRLRCGTGFRCRYSRKPEGDRVYQQADPAWTGVALRRVIEHAVADLGPAGRTPHLLRRWRGLLPIADAYDRHVEQVNLRHRTRETHAAEQRAQEALYGARARVQAIPAKTAEGLAAHVRMFDGSTRENIPRDVLPLLLSAASVAGVTINFRDQGSET